MKRLLLALMLLAPGAALATSVNEDLVLVGSWDTNAATRVRLCRTTATIAACGTCTADKAECCFHTDTDALAICTAVDTWTDLGSGGGSGDITSVGDCASGDCFTASGTQSNNLFFEGATPDGNEIILTAADATSDKTLTLPNETGTVCSSGSICSGYQAGPLTGDVQTSGAAATIQANSVALGTDTTNNYVAGPTTDDGLEMVGTEGATLGVKLPAATNALSSTVTSGSGLETLAAGLTLLQGCSNGEMLKWDESTDLWGCAADSTGGSPTFDTIASGTNVTATMTCGTGCTVNSSGSGTIVATTAAALAANGGNCTAGSAPLGVDASGAVETCTDYEEDLANSAGLAAALSDETGTTLAVFSNSPVFTDDLDIASTGVRLTGTDGVLTILGLGNGNDENLAIDLDNAAANIVSITSGTGVTDFDFNTLDVNTDTLDLTGTGTLNGLDVIDATGEATLEATLDIAGDVSSTGMATTVIGADKVLEPMLKIVDTGIDEDVLTRETGTGDFEWHSRDEIVAGTSEGALPDASVIEADLKVVGGVTDEFCLTAETGGGGDFEWQACGGGGGNMSTTVYDIDVDGTVDNADGVSCTNCVANSELAGRTALSVMGRSVNSAGDVADIGTSGSSNFVLRENGGILQWGTLAAGSLASDSVTEAKLKVIVGDTAIDEECLTFESTNGDFEWQSCGAGGGIATVEENNASVTTAATNLDFLGADFNVTGATVEADVAIDYTNGQKATTSIPGFLTAADWTTFNAKQSALVNSAGLEAALSDETGTTLAVFSNSPVFTDDFDLAAAGVRQTGADGVLTLLGLGNGNDEALAVDFDNAAANVVGVSSSTGVTDLDLGTIDLNTDTVDLTGTGTLNGLDAIDGTGETTLEAALDIAGDVASTGMSTTVIADAAVQPSDFDATNAASTADCLTKAAGDQVTWATCGAGGGPATALDTTGAAVDVSAAAPPLTGKALRATSPTTATWQYVPPYSIRSGRKVGYAQVLLSSMSVLQVVGMTGLGSAGATFALAGAIGSTRMYMAYQTNGTNPNTAGVVGSSQNVYPVWRPLWGAHVLTEPAISLRRVWIALAESSTISALAHTTGTAGSTNDYVGVGFDTSVNANWLCCSGDGTNHGCTSMGVAVTASTEYTVEVDFSVPAQITCRVNGTTLVKTSNLSSQTTTLWGVYATNTALAAASHLLYVSGVYLETN